MPAIFTDLPKQIGDYTLLTLLGTQDDRDFYEAQQNHVGRIVIVEIIDAKKTTITPEYFIASTRARVSEQIPGAVPVFEAVQLKDYWLVAQERPKGKSLAMMAAQEEQLDALSTCRLLEQVCELYRYCNSHNINTTFLTANTVYRISDNQFSFLSPARAIGNEEISRADKMAELAELIIPVLPVNVAGQNRIYTLISWLQQGYEGQMLNWATIGSTASLIIEQLHPELAAEMASTYNNEQLLKQGKKNQWFSYFSILFGGIIALMSQLAKPATVDSPNFEEFIINERSIAALSCPVSVQEYRQFLNKLGSMSQSELDRLHKGLPSTNRDHKPNNWGQQLQLLKNKNTCTSPVHSVSYWDAIVYARLNRVQIPSAGQLQFIKAQTDVNDFAEWSSDTQDLPLYNKCFILVNADGSINREEDPLNSSTKTTFRIIKTNKR